MGAGHSCRQQWRLKTSTYSPTKIRKILALWFLKADGEGGTTTGGGGAQLLAVVAHISRLLSLRAAQTHRAFANYAAHQRLTQ